MAVACRKATTAQLQAVVDASGNQAKWAADLTVARLAGPGWCRSTSWLRFPSCKARHVANEYAVLNCQR
jgi:hypothetical protein